MFEQAIPQSKPLASVALYRHFDAAGRLLYVGISLSAVYRLSQHMDGSSWADEIKSMTVERYSTREEAHAAERQAIRDEEPIHNVKRYRVSVTASEVPTEPRAAGTYRPSVEERAEIVDAIFRPRFPFRSLSGIASCLGLDPDYLAQFIAEPDGEPVQPTYDDLFAIGDRLVRGTLVSEAPWIIGSPLPSHITEVTVPQRGRPRRTSSNPEARL